jgi:hypothetical protein
VSLIDFTDYVGIPETLVTDGAAEFTGKHTDFIKQARRMWIKLHTAEQGRKNQKQSCGGMGNWFFIKALEATDAEEKCLFSVVGLWSSIWSQVVNKNVMW